MDRFCRTLLRQQPGVPRQVSNHGGKICSDYHGDQRQAKPTDPSSRHSMRVITHSDNDLNSFESRLASKVAFTSLIDGENPSAQNSLQTKLLPTRHASTP
jgi:hypothetical protein